MTYDIWSAFVSPNINLKSAKHWFLRIPRPTLPQHHDIRLPNDSQYRIALSATYGGMTYPWKRCFKSKFYDQILKQEVNYDQLKEDYLENLDVVSLYPAAMAEGDFPVGPCSNVLPSELEWIQSNHDYAAAVLEKETHHKGEFVSYEIPLGIYEVDYECPGNLITPVLPKKELKEDKHGRCSSMGLTWNLLPGTGWYTSVDLQNAQEAGYKFTFKKGIKWGGKAKLFRDFILMAFELKAQAQRDNNPAMRQVAKIFMNALYGKMLQKPIIENTEIVLNHMAATKFMTKNDLTGIVSLSWEEEGIEHHGAIFKVG